MTPRHTIDDFVNAFGLKQKGKEFVGPCPVCKDGEDRFHVREGNAGPIFGCRYCIDGEQDADGSNAKQVLSLLQERQCRRARSTHTARATQASGTAQAATAAVGQRRYGVSLHGRWRGTGHLRWCGATARTEPRRLANGHPLETMMAFYTPTAPNSPVAIVRFANGGGWHLVELRSLRAKNAYWPTQLAWPKQTITCWAGGTNSWDKADWSPLAGRDVSLVADGDVPGHKAMLALAAHLHGLGCKVKIALPPVEWDSDIADWIAEQGKDGAAKILGDLLHDYEPPVAPNPNRRRSRPPNCLKYPPTRWITTRTIGCWGWTAHDWRLRCGRRGNRKLSGDGICRP